MTKREGFKSLAERLNPRASELGLVVEADKMFAELERRLADLELREELCVAPSRAKPGKAYMEALLDQPGTHQAFASHGVGQGPASSERLAASQDELKSTPAKTSEPEVTEVTNEMLHAAWRVAADRGYKTSQLPTRAFADIYLAMRLLEPQRPVEITELMLESALWTYTNSIAANETPRISMQLAMQAALATPPNEGETR